MTGGAAPQPQRPRQPQGQQPPPDQPPSPPGQQPPTGEQPATGQQPPGQPQPAGQQPAQGQPQTGDPQQPVFRAGINFVRVDVIITDRNGNQIADLQPADFDVIEDGKPQKIETFKLVKLDGGVSSAIKEPPKDIRTDFDEESEAAREDVRLFAIFLDDYHVRRGASMAVRNPLSRFIETQLGPSDMIGIMYPLESTSAVRMTRNHDAVQRGLQQFLGRKYDYTPRNQFEERYAYYPTEVVERIRNQVSLSALKSLIVHMGSLKEGRKALIVVSEGYTNALPPQMRDANSQFKGSGNPNAFNPAAGMNDPNEDRYQFFSNLDLDTDLREVYDTANRNNVAIYAVDPRGLPGFEFDIDQGVGSLQMDAKYLNATMDTLRVLSDNTDGRAIVNRNDLDVGMKQITRDSSAYYLIGYSSSQSPSDGKFHEIKVRVKRPGAQVRARKGYWALTATETAKAMAPPKPGPPKAVEEALAAVGRPNRAAVVRTWIGTSRGENGKTRVTFVWEPVPKTPGESPAARSGDPSRVSLMALGPDGAPYFRGRVPDVALASAAPRTTSAAGATSTPRGPSRVTFEAPPGKMQLRVSVEGNGSEVLDSEMREINVPDLTSAQTVFGTPQLFRARTVREYQQLKTDPDAVPVAGREFTRSDRLLIRVPAYGPAATAPTLSVHILNRAGQPMTELTAAPAAQPAEQQIEVPVTALAPGEYIVEIKAGGESGEAKELLGFRIVG
jgi:VWFA-related protein